MKNLGGWMGRTVFVLALGLAGPVWADEPANEPAALALYEKGIALETAGEWAKAEVQFQESLKLHARPRTAAHLGRVQVEQGKFVEGATNIEWFFKEDTEVPLEKKEGARQPLIVALKNVGILKLNIEPIDASVFIDGQVVPAKRMGWPQYVTPTSPHTVEVKKDGFVTESETWMVAAGSEKLVKITLKPAPVDVGKGREVGPVKPKPMPSLVKGAWIAGGVLGAVAIGTAIAARQTYETMEPCWKNPVCSKAAQDAFQSKKTQLDALSITALSTGIFGAIVLSYAGVSTFVVRGRTVGVFAAPTPNGGFVEFRW